MNCKSFETKRYWMLGLAVVLAAPLGCGDGRPTVVPVSGQVLIDGEPLEFGFIRVVPADARPASGKIEADGRFTLKTFEDGDGALVGSHPVTITAGEYISDEETMWHAPEKYSRAETSDLTVDIEGPTDSLVVNISWDGDQPYRTFNGARVK